MWHRYVAFRNADPTAKIKPADVGIGVETVSVGTRDSLEATMVEGWLLPTETFVARKGRQPTGEELTWRIVGAKKVYGVFYLQAVPGA